jgi:hypothetical protein
MPTTLYFDLVSGASGDMILASLVDCGVPAAFLNRELGKLKIPGLKIGASRVLRNGITCVQMKMKWQTAKEYRHSHDILSLIKKAGYDKSIENNCQKVLGRIAQAESKVHGIPEDQVHFHEIGAVDTIVDIVGVCLALAYLKVSDIQFSVLTEGHGTIVCEHGVMPVPAPATEQLMRGFLVRRVDVATELLTPTGCALLTTLGQQELLPPEGRAVRTGYGCGTKTFDTHPNFLRAVLVETSSENSVDTVCVIETDVDHLTGEIMGNVSGVLLETGALDVSWTPLYMKKGRPGHRLTVIASPENSPKFIDLVMLHTRTLGVRVQTLKRVIAERESAAGTFDGVKITEKKCSYKGHSFKKAEYEDLAKLAKAKNVPLIEVMENYRASLPAL